jgi:predicted small secreted protein
MKEQHMVKGLLRGALGSMLIVGVAAGLGACNTMEGFGKDMSAAGRALSGSAERTKNGGSPFSASNSGSGAAEAANSTASNGPASGPPTPTSPSASGSGGTSSSAPVTPVTPVN